MLCKVTVRADGCEPTVSGGGSDPCLGGRRAGLPRGLARLAGGTITTGTGSGASPARPGDGRRLPLYPLGEDVLGLRLGQGVPVGYGVDGPLGGLADVVENPPSGDGLDAESGDAQSVRYRLDCRRS